MALLDVSGMTIRFGGLTAVDDLNFHVEQGEIVSIIGPNGAGKTTVFNMLTGVYQMNAGTILYNGTSLGEKSCQEIVEAGISRTFQNIRLFGNLRVIENVLQGAHVQVKYGFFDMLLRTRRFRNQEREKAQQAVDILESIGLGYRMHDYARNLPYGEQRKLEIARAIATGAKLILLDEPAAGMNPKESE